MVIKMTSIIISFLLFLGCVSYEASRKNERMAVSDSEYHIKDSPVQPPRALYDRAFGNPDWRL
jgi:hypothetical protein